MKTDRTGGLRCVDFWGDNLTGKGVPDWRTSPFKCVSNCGLWHLCGRLPPGGSLHFSGTAATTGTLMWEHL